MKYKLGLILVLFSASLLSPASCRAFTDPELRQILLHDLDVDNNMAEIFALGDAIVPQLISALDDHDGDVVLRAQFMLFLIGNEKGIDRVHRYWDETPFEKSVVANAPISVPLTDWDYRQIDSILTHPIQFVADRRSLDLVIALRLDGSAKANQLLQQILEKNPDAEKRLFLPPNSLKLRKKTASLCCGGNLKTFALKNDFYIPLEYRLGLNAQVEAYANNKSLALLRLSQVMGNTYLVVLKRSGKCWRFQSTFLYSVT